MSKLVRSYSRITEGKLLVVGTSGLPAGVDRSGFDITSLTEDDFRSRLDVLRAQSFGFCILGSLSCLGYVRRLMQVEGTLLLQTPGASADTLQIYLLSAGFGDCIFTPDYALARAKHIPASHRLSVIVPVYNEAATCGELLDRLLTKQIPGVEIEIVIVESNSDDGSRQIVQRYTGHPRVRLLLEGRAQGKGHAVRTGFEAVTGTIILIQDADLEYDIDDYDALLAPILAGQANFILGSRHSESGTSWKIRKFATDPWIAAFFNFGHLLFLRLFNFLYRQKLSDPFTMFKVFRRECLYGLSFESNRFDFDYELVIKLLRKGYRPIELPVNYVSRSLSEGKKVTVFRDPLTWIAALLKFRRSKLYELEERSPKTKSQTN